MQTSTTQSEQFVPLNTLGPLALRAHRTLRERQHLALPKPSRILARITRDGKFTKAVLRSGGRIAVGVSAKNPDDRESHTKGEMTALVRALREMGAR